MGFWEQFPYTNFHEMNLNWLIRKIRELNDRITKNLDDEIEEKVKNAVDKLYLNIVYEAATKSIKIKTEVLK